MRKLAMLVSFIVLISGPGFAASTAACSKLATAPFGSQVKIVSASVVPATSALPEHCEVRGTIWPEDGFAIELPTGWNGRFYMVGDFAWAGAINFRQMTAGLSKGYATASTNAGHDARKEPGATFGYPSAGNPNADRKVIDWGYQSVHETATLAKKIMQAYYGKAPLYSYWVSCSTGGRQGLSEAQRFPKDFNGVVVGAPQISPPRANMAAIWNGQAQTGPGNITDEMVPALARAVYKKCDAVDGLRDGIIDDPRKCMFDPDRDLPKCADGKSGSTCFTSAQIAALKKIYAGPKNSTGKQLYPQQLVSAEPGWKDTIAGAYDGSVERAESYMRYMFLNPPPRPGWNYKMYNFDTDPPRMADAAAKVDAANPDLRQFQRDGGKIIHYHGWADPSINPLVSLAYYKSVVKTMGASQAKEFYRLYMVPGMAHCKGGPGCGNVDWFTPMVNWVEKGVAPEMLIGSHVEGDKVTRTRPICPYPKVARYKGSGSIDVAGSFTCADPDKSIP